MKLNKFSTKKKVTYRQNKYWPFALSGRWAFLWRFAASIWTPSMFAFHRTFHLNRYANRYPFTITSFQLTLEIIESLAYLFCPHRYHRIESNDHLLWHQRSFYILYCDTFHRRLKVYRYTRLLSSCKSHWVYTEFPKNKSNFCVDICLGFMNLFLCKKYVKIYDLFRYFHWSQISLNKVLAYSIWLWYNADCFIVYPYVYWQIF